MTHTQKGKKPGQHSRGVALVTALLLLSLFTVMTLSMVIATTSDTLIDGYYRNFRGSFYAADSGITTTREYMLQQIMSNIPPTYTVANGAPPIPANVPDVGTTRGTVMTNVIANFGTYQSVTGTQAASWPGSFQIDTTATFGINNTSLLAGTSAAVPPYSDACTVQSSPTATPEATPPVKPTCTTLGTPAAAYNITGYTHTYSYKITTVGQSRANETHTIEEDGSFIIKTDKGTPAGTNTNFAAYGMFIDQWGICPSGGGTLVNGTISGPVFTNGSWNLNSGSYIFTDAVGSHGANFGFTDGNGCTPAPGSTTTHAYTASDGTNFNPTFQGSVTLGAPTVPLPADSFNQKRAVLDSQGLNDTDPTYAEMNTSLKNINRTSYPAAGASSGVYLPYTATGAGGTCPCTMNGGGIYVEGNATVTVTASGSTAQVYTIVNNSATTTVTIDTAANTTTIQTGATTTTMTGVPTQKDALGNVQRNATLLYVNGNITALKGGGEGVGAIQDSTALDVVANGNVTVTGDILYKTEPVTKTTADSLIAGNDHGQVLGIFTATGDIQLNNSQSSTNLEIDASVATLSAGGTGGIVNTGSGIGTLNIVGGRIQNQIKNIGASSRNVYFDRRFAQGGFAPPWFPSTTIVSNGVVNDVISVSPPNRVSWTDKTAM